MSEAIKNNQNELFLDVPEGFAVERLSLSEGVSELGVMEAVLISKNPAVSVADMLFQSVKFRLMVGDKLEVPRFLTGIITRFVQAETRHGHVATATEKRYVYRVEVRPKMYLLQKVFRSRVYYRLTLKDIVNEICKELRITCSWQLTAEPKEREYTLQYEETCFDFVARLLEEEGVNFYYDHVGEQMVFINKAKAYPVCTPFNKAIYSEDTSSHFTIGDEERVSRVVVSDVIRPQTSTVSHYHPDTAAVDLTRQVSGQAPHQVAATEVYEHGQKVQSPEEAQAMAQLRQEALVARKQVLQGYSTCRSLAAGHYVDLENHFNAAYNRRWLVTTIQMDIVQGLYECRFEAVPSDVMLRPERQTPRPLVQGVQTAVVVGPEDRRIDEHEYLDPLGRIKIQFHWDREGKKNDRSSMWVRVANPYAGKNYGSQWVPRIGHEVLVEFLQGDPDQPVVVGCLHNSEFPPPLTPAQKQHSVIATRRGNTLTSIDVDDKEQLLLNARRDYTVTVGNDAHETVKQNKTVTVNGDIYSLDVPEGQAAFSAAKSVSVRCGAHTVKLAPKKAYIGYDGGEACGITITPSKITVAGPFIQITASDQVVINGGTVEINPD